MTEFNSYEIQRSLDRFHKLTRERPTMSVPEARSKDIINERLRLLSEYERVFDLQIERYQQFLRKVERQRKRIREAGKERERLLARTTSTLFPEVAPHQPFLQQSALFSPAVHSQATSFHSPSSPLPQLSHASGEQQAIYPQHLATQNAAPEFSTSELPHSVPPPQLQPADRPFPGLSTPSQSASRTSPSIALTTQTSNLHTQPAVGSLGDSRDTGISPVQSPLSPVPEPKQTDIGVRPEEHLRSSSRQEDTPQPSASRPPPPPRPSSTHSIRRDTVSTSGAFSPVRRVTPTLSTPSSPTQLSELPVFPTSSSSSPRRFSSSSGPFLASSTPTPSPSLSSSQTSIPPPPPPRTTPSPSISLAHTPSATSSPSLPSPHRSSPAVPSSHSPSLSSPSLIQSTSSHSSSSTYPSSSPSSSSLQPASSVFSSPFAEAVTSAFVETTEVEKQKPAEKQDKEKEKSKEEKEREKKEKEKKEREEKAKKAQKGAESKKMPQRSSLAIANEEDSDDDDDEEDPKEKLRRENARFKPPPLKPAGDALPEAGTSTQPISSAGGAAEPSNPSSSTPFTPSSSTSPPPPSAASSLRKSARLSSLFDNEDEDALFGFTPSQPSRRTISSPTEALPSLSSSTPSSSSTSSAKKDTDIDIDDLFRSQPASSHTTTRRGSRLRSAAKRHSISFPTVQPTSAASEEDDFDKMLPSDSP